MDALQPASYRAARRCTGRTGSAPGTGRGPAPEAGGPGEAPPPGGNARASSTRSSRKQVTSPFPPLPADFSSRFGPWSGPFCLEREARYLPHAAVRNHRPLRHPRLRRVTLRRRHGLLGHPRFSVGAAVPTRPSARGADVAVLAYCFVTPDFSVRYVSGTPTGSMPCTTCSRPLGARTGRSCGTSCYL